MATQKSHLSYDDVVATLPPPNLLDATKRLRIPRALLFMFFRYAPCTRRRASLTGCVTGVTFARKEALKCLHRIHE